MRFHYQIGGREQRLGWHSSWIGRVLAVFVAAGLLVVGFFFFTILLAAGVVAFVVMVIRWWWFAKKLQKLQTNESAEVIDVKSVVLHDDAADPPTETRLWPEP